MNGAWTRTLWRLGGWTGVGLIAYLSLRPFAGHVISAGRESGHFEHFLAYSLLMLWWCQGVSGNTRRLRLWALLSGLAVAMEFAQMLTPDRTFEWLDMAVGALACATGWLLAPPRTPDLLVLAQRCERALARRPR